MWNVTPVALLEITARTTLVYIVLVIGIRLSGKRQIGQMTAFDLVVLLLLSNAVQNAMTGPDTSVTGGVVAAITLLCLNKLAARLRLAHPTFRRLLVGSPVALVINGHIQYSALKDEQMTVDDLMEDLREHEVSDIGNVDLATLEVDGEVSVVRKPSTSDAGGTFIKSKKKVVRHHKR